MSQRTWWVLAALLLADFGGTHAATQAGAPGLPSWMVGCWAGADGPEVVRERWIAADAATLLGTSHTVKGGVLTAFEFLRVVRKNGRAVYVAQPGGVPPTEFGATGQTAAAITFENPAHDFPKRVGYQRVDDTHLTAWIDGGVAGGGPRIEYPMRRERCEP